MQRHLRLTLVTAVLLPGGVLSAAPIGTGFTYQGALKKNGVGVTGTADVTFTLWDEDDLGVQTGGSHAISNVQVANGLFTVQVNTGNQFGASAFNGQARWLEVAVRSPAGSGAFATLTPRQAVSATPYAIKAISPDGHSLDAADGDPTDVVFVSNTGTVGVNSLNPAATMHVQAKTATGFRVDSITTGFTDIAVHGVGADVGGMFESSDPFGRAVHGRSLNAGPNARAGYFEGHVYAQGNVGIGAINPVSALDVRGHLTLDPGMSPILYTAAGAGEQDRYLQLINSPITQSASGLKAGGVLVSDTYGYANPGKNDLVVKGTVSAGGDALQARDKGGWVKAMAKVSANATIARQYSALGGTITVIRSNEVYRVTFPFQVSDRFIMVTVHEVVGLPNGYAVVWDSCGGCLPNAVLVSIHDPLDDNALIAGDFFIFVY